MLTSQTARDHLGEGTDTILRMKEYSLAAVQEKTNTMGAMAEGSLAGALWEHSILLAYAGILIFCCRFCGGTHGR